eukprot:3926565-Rhodomonas_salina.4
MAVACDDSCCMRCHAMLNAKVPTCIAHTRIMRTASYCKLPSVECSLARARCKALPARFTLASR